jgi:hypothetical protein
MYFVLMFGVMLILPIPYLFCIAMFSSEDTSHLKIILVPGISSPRQVVPFISSLVNLIVKSKTND